MAELRAYACGDTSHNLSRVVRGTPREKRVFPSTVFLYDDGHRRILFDTGYAPLPWQTGVAGAIYRRLLPPRIEQGESIADQLDPDSVTHVVLSHLHPDHIGGIRFFPRATFVLHAGLLATLASPRLREGVLRGLVPSWFESASPIVVDDFPDRRFGLGVADVFGDGSYLLVDLPGHARGHSGALVEERVLLAGDAAWGRDFLGAEDRLRAVPRKVAHDRGAQARTAQALLAAEAGGVRLHFSHDPQPVGVNLL